MGNGFVSVGFVYGQSTVTPQWRRSHQFALLPVLAAGRLWGEYAHEASGVHIPDARCDVVREFLSDPGQPEWLWMVDTDASYAEDTLMRLLEAAHPKTRPIVGALAFGVAPTHEHLNESQAVGLYGLPTLTVFDDDNEPRRLWDYPPDRLVQVHLTGCHCLLIHRSVLEHKGWQDGHPLPWFRTAVMGERKVSEDGFFCLKAGSLGFPIFVHTGIKTGHVKTFVADEEWYLRNRAVEPASEPVAVLVPVMRRPHNAEPFMRHLRASTGLATVYAIADDEDVDTIAAWRAAGAEVLISTRGSTFAKKINHGYLNTTEPWLFVVGDDARFRPGWYDHAIDTARRANASVIGTNDLANPRVMRGEHGTHLLVARSYVDEHGGSWGEELVCHEGYRHNFVDDELVTVAKQRGAWASAVASIVEHHHPIVGAPTDDVYRLGSQSFDRDRRLFEKRAKEHLS